MIDSRMAGRQPTSTPLAATCAFPGPETPRVKLKPRPINHHGRLWRLLTAPRDPGKERDSDIRDLPDHHLLVSNDCRLCSFYTTSSLPLYTKQILE